MLLRTPAFARMSKRYAKRDRATRDALAEAVARLETDPFDPRLRTHKLQGRLAETWACSAGYDLRVLFEFPVVNEERVVVLLAVGTHDEVYGTS